MFSKACEYAIKASIYVCHRSSKGERCGLKDIAKATDSPEAFTAKILQQLVRNKILDSQKGPNGGFFTMDKGDGGVKLITIVEAIDGDKIFAGCGLGLKECNEINPCPLHNRFGSIRDGLREMLENTSLVDLSNEFKDGLTFLE